MFLPTAVELNNNIYTFISHGLIMLKRILCLGVILLIVPLGNTQSSLTRNFFVNPENGQSRVKIVYGAYAAEEDYENALKIAQAVG